MALAARGHVNGDDVFLAWTYPKTPGCWGFEIAREITHPNGAHYSDVLTNYVGFAKDHAAPNEGRPSNVWPFQRYTWTDHGVNQGDKATYTITPVLGPLAQPVPDVTQAVTIGPLDVSASAGTTAHPIEAVFNRGILMSQFITKKLPNPFTKSDIANLVKTLGGADKELRSFLSGPLGVRLAKILDDAAAATDVDVYAALYELTDDALIKKLVKIGQRAHVVLSNGSDKMVGGDGNKVAAGILTGKIDLHRRMLGSEGLGHNKFLVVCKKGKPVAAWTGSTNWATTGLCTQINNGVLISDKSLGQAYLDQWTLLRDDRRVDAHGKERHFAPPLVNANDVAKTGGTATAGWTLWFTRTSDGREMDAVADVINGAKKAIFFLMFEPGTAGLLQVIQARLSPASPTFDPQLYVHGVANTLTPDNKTLAVTTVGQGTARPFDLKLVQPQGVGAAFGNWAKEVTRSEFLKTQGGVVGYAVIHSKVIVVDPFTKPVVITGSHNFSHSASSKNDENLLIVRGNKKLAERYVINVMATYQHYRWRAYLRECQDRGIEPWQNLREDDKWQKKQADHDLELKFWVG